MFVLTVDGVNVIRRGIMYEVLKTVSKPNMSLLMILKLFY